MKRFYSLFFFIILACACGKGDIPAEEGYKYEAVFIGDSITANWVREDRGHPDFFKDHNFLGMGYSGKTTDYLKRLFKASVIDKHPRQAVILGGSFPSGNDYYRTQQTNQGSCRRERIWICGLSLCPDRRERRPSFIPIQPNNPPSSN